MKHCIEKKKCMSCQHYTENRYHYYTYDNRMVEYHVYECQKQEWICHTHTEIDCISFEKKREILG